MNYSSNWSVIGYTTLIPLNYSEYSIDFGIIYGLNSINVATKFSFSST